MANLRVSILINNVNLHEGEHSLEYFCQKGQPEKQIVNLNFCTWFLEHPANKCLLVTLWPFIPAVSQSIRNNYGPSVLPQVFRTPSYIQGEVKISCSLKFNVFSLLF